MDLTCHVYKTERRIRWEDLSLLATTERYVRWRLYNGAMHSLKGVSLIGTTGRIIRQEDYLLSATTGRTIRQEGYPLNDPRERIIRWEDYERTRVKDVVLILLLVSKRGESFRRLVT